MQKGIGARAMVEMGDAAIETLAKTLAERNGFEWQLEFKPPLPPQHKTGITANSGRCGPRTVSNTRKGTVRQPRETGVAHVARVVRHIVDMLRS